MSDCKLCGGDRQVLHVPTNTIEPCPVCTGKSATDRVRHMVEDDVSRALETVGALVTRFASDCAFCGGSRKMLNTATNCIEPCPVCQKKESKKALEDGVIEAYGEEVK